MAGAGPIAEMLPVGGNPAHGLAFGLLLIGALALAGGLCLAARPGCRSSASSSPR